MNEKMVEISKDKKEQEESYVKSILEGVSNDGFNAISIFEDYQKNRESLFLAVNATETLVDEINSSLDALPRLVKLNMDTTFSFLKAGMITFNEKIGKIKSSRDRWIIYDEMPLTRLAFYNPKTEKFDEDLDKEDIPKMVSALTSNEYFKPFEKIMQRALEAHSNKDYLVSIPLFILATDGILIKFAEKHGLLKDNGKCIEEFGSDFKGHPNMNKVIPLLSKFYNTIPKEFADFIKDKKSDSDREGLWEFRNKVMHGINPSYEDAQWSCRLMFVVFLLHDLLWHNNFLIPIKLKKSIKKCAEEKDGNLEELGALLIEEVMKFLKENKVEVDMGAIETELKMDIDKKDWKNLELSIQKYIVDSI